MIILVAHNFYKQPGGEDECVTAEAAVLKAHGHEVIQYCVHNDSIDGMNQLKLASKAIWSQSTYHELRELIRMHRPQIAHFHNTFPLISPAAYYAARAEKVPVVQTLHNFRLLCPQALFFRNGRICMDCLGRSIPWPGVLHKCYRGSRSASAVVGTMLGVHRALGTWRHAVDTYIALTEFSREKFIEGGLPQHKIHIKPNFVYSDPGPGAGTGGYGVFVGRLSEEKGLNTLLKAWQLLGGSVPLKIVGDGPLAGLVADAAAKDSAITWLGRMPAKDVYALVGQAVFLVFPSNCYETFGRVVIEAFAKGTPVIASNLGSMAELVEHGRTGLLFEPANAVDLASALRGLLARPLELKSMRLAARQEYEEKYTAESNYRALMAIYEQACRGSGFTTGAISAVGARGAGF
jgi:glycosyltransferase involved in cell wall biosynthesis